MLERMPYRTLQRGAIVAIEIIHEDSILYLDFAAVVQPGRRSVPSSQPSDVRIGTFCYTALSHRSDQHEQSVTDSYTSEVGTILAVTEDEDKEDRSQGECSA